MQVYLDDVRKMLAFVQNSGIPPLAAGLAGAMFIRNALDVMGGDPGWWKMLIDPDVNIEDLLQPLSVPGANPTGTPA
jgi:hypothetical protein